MALVARYLEKTNQTSGLSSRGTVYYIADTEAERPSSGLSEGDLCYTKDTDTLWKATDATTWAEVGGGGGTPASSVVAETSYGQASAVGTSTNYAREDHTHGSPSLGTTGSTACAGNDARLSDARTPLAHALGGSEHTDDTLANLNAKINDADVVALAGQIGGTAASPDIRGLRETGGPTLLTMAAVADGQTLRRNGTTIDGYTPAAGGVNVGTAILDFGAFPGASDASVAVTGQAGIVSGSVVIAKLRPSATADHSADEHMLETLEVYAGNIVPGTGFTIYGVNKSQLNEPLFPGGEGRAATAVVGAQSGDGMPRVGGIGTRIWGQWSVDWMWA
jgi:hypothetical protein